MTPSSQEIAFVVATKDRPEDLRKMLRSLGGQSRSPAQVVIVDASATPVEAVAGEFPALSICYLRHLPPSASAQRNAGVKAVSSGIPLVGFMDDDAVLDEGAIEAMLRFWQTAPADVGGCAFNWMNPPAKGRLGAWLKRSRLVRWLGLYSHVPGRVTPSGWHTMPGAVDRNLWVDWLCSTASVWRRSVLDEFRFEEFFDGYSYLEDLDFSYSVRKKYRLAIVADAGFRHYPPGRPKSFSFFRFGRTEVRNRLFFVKKNRLSLPRFCLAAFVNAFLNLFPRALLGRRYVARAAGNIAELVRLAFSRR